jgi:hypothetical protein
MELVIGGVDALRSRMTAAFEEAVAGPFACVLTGGSTALLYLGGRAPRGSRRLAVRPLLLGRRTGGVGR